MSRLALALKCVALPCSVFLGPCLAWHHLLPAPSCPPQLIAGGLQSGQWGRKKAAAAALSRICESSGDALAPHTAALLGVLLKVMPALGTGACAHPVRTLRAPHASTSALPRPALPARLQEVPGRIWDGKECVLGAVGTLSAACTPALMPPQRHAVLAALLDAAGKKKAAYRKEAMVQLEKALLAFAGPGGSGGGGAEPNGAAAEEAAVSGDYYSLVAPLMIELVGSYVEAAQGGAMDTDAPQQAAAALPGEVEPHPGKAVPAAQVAACLGAAFATAAPGTARAHADAACVSLAALLGAAGRPADRLAAVAAGCRLAEHAAAVQRQAQPGGAPVLSSLQDGVAALLQVGLRLAEEGKAAQLREESYRLRCAPAVAAACGLCRAACMAEFGVEVRAAGP